jgi:indolepyruvate ferredoxin oxidoreductase alpha subunit
MLKTAVSKLGKALLSGNEAIARGSLEAGVRVVAGYPGTPSTEIIETLVKEADDYGIHVEWSTNEKVAIEVAAGASIAGLRSMVCMKHVGLNWASDPLMCINLSGVNGGLVIVSADDPGAQSSQNEQDSRFYGLFSELLTFEPSTPSEAKGMVIESFNISERLKLPVLLRSVPKVSHSYEIIQLNPMHKLKIAPKFEHDKRFVVTGAGGWAVHLHELLHDKKAKMQLITDSSNFNVLHHNDDAKLGIITSGVAYTYVREAVKLLKTKKVSVLKFGTVFPLSKLLVKKIASLTPKILIVEEGEPFLEQQVRSISGELCEVEFMGKLTGDLPSVGELNVNHVLNAIANLLNIKINNILSKRQRTLDKLEAILPPRILTMCAGCPHRATFYVIKQIVRRVGRDKVHLCGDIGCYSFGAQPPFNLVDVKYCMGASIGVACGLASSGVDGTIFALIGDGTFIHAGIPALINAVYNSAKIVIVVLDNQIVAMTGFQPHPGTGRTATGKYTKKIILEDLARACGVNFVEVFDPYDLDEAKKVMERAVKHEGVAVVISRRECATEFLRRARKEGIVIRKYWIDQDKCTRCRICVKEFGCPAFSVENDEIRIIRDMCIGCGVCAQICPSEAIKESE